MERSRDSHRRLVQGACRVVGELFPRSGAVRFVRLPRFEVMECLGEGMTSEVYRALDRDLGRHVALKLLRGRPTEVLRRRFKREAEATAGLSHPNLVALYDAGEHDGRMYLVMELVEGRPFSEILKEPDKDRLALVTLFEKAVRGVAAAHEKGVVHRDLKPANILVSTHNDVKVTDFGLAQLLGSGSSLTHQGQALGTPLYMAPEQIRGERETISPRTDVYALGSILYEIIAGRPPHRAQTIPELYGRILDKEPPSLPSRGQGIGKDLAAITMKALEKDPCRRYGNAREMAEELRRYLAGEPVLARPSGALLTGLRWLRRRSLLPALAMLLGAGGLLAFSHLLQSQRTEVARVSVEARIREAQLELDEHRQEIGDKPEFLTQADFALSRGVRHLKGGSLDLASKDAEDALLVVKAQGRIRTLERMAEHLKREGCDVSPFQAACKEFQGALAKGGVRTLESTTDILQAGLRSSAPALKDHLTRKVLAVQSGVDAWKEAGRDPQEVVSIMKDFQPLFSAGRVFEADAILDEALLVLGPAR